MTHETTRAGKVLRALLFATFSLVTVLALLIGVWVVRSVKADDQELQRRAPQSQSIDSTTTQLSSKPIGLPGPPHIPGTTAQYGPVIETSYRDETTTVMVPEFDPVTGKQVMRTREVVRKVPVQTTRWVKSYTTTTESAHAQRTMQLANELRLMKEDDESRESKLKELRALLEAEFTQLHEKQFAEIERTEKRLESLKVLHDTRGENKANIVERRIGELLGKADPFRWNAAPVQPAPRTSQPTPQYSYPTTRSSTQDQNAGGFRPQRSVLVPVEGYAPSTFLPDTPHKNSAPLESITRDPYLQTRPIPNSPAAPPSGQQLPQSQKTQLIPTPTYYDAPGTVPSTAQVRVGVPRTAISEIFHLARSSATANAELAAAETEYESMMDLRTAGAVPIHEFNLSKLKLEKCKREVKLIDMQLEAFSEAMERVKALAELTLQRESSKLNAVTAVNRKGIYSEEEVTDAKYEVEKAQTALADATENIKRLQETMKMVQDFDNGETEASGAEEAVGKTSPREDTDSSGKADPTEARRP